MPPKRPASSLSPSKSPKKAKTKVGALDAFFRPSQVPQTQLESDEAFARKLAAEEGHSYNKAVSNSAGPSRSLSYDGISSQTAILIDDDDDDSPTAKPLLPIPALKIEPLKPSAPIQRPDPEGPRPAKKPKLTISSNEPINYPDLGQDPLTFDAQMCPWSQTSTASPAPYSFLAHVLSQLSQTKSRILLLNTLTNALRLLILHDPPSIIPALYMVSNSISPSYIPMELAVGPKILSNALMSISGLSSGALRRLYHTHGDPGDVAFEAKASIRTLIPHPPLSLQGVYESLLKIARAKGNGAQKQKQSIVERLLLSAKGEEVRFIMRTLSMHLRVGAVRTTILTAFARASVLARPTGATIPEDSRLFATQDELASVLPLPEKKGKRKDDVVDEARVSIIAKMAAADALLRTVYVKHPNYETIVKEFLASGLEGLLERVPLTVGIPLHPTLGSPTRSLDEIYERLGDLPFAAEYKYDGQRAQIHVMTTSNGIDVKVFSRHLEDMTDKYPDIVIMMKRYSEEERPIPPSTSSSPDMPQSDVTSNRKAPVSLIIDSEIVAWDAKNNITKSFQELSNRPRKDVKLHQVNIPVCLFVFDLMYLNGEQLLSVPFRERRRLLQETLPPREMPTSPGGARLKHVTSLDSDCPGGRDEIEAFWEVAVDSQCEGLMIKLLDSGEVVEEVQPLNPGSLPPSPSKRPQTRKKPLPATYEPDKRTSAWLKLKKDYVKGIGDTLDLVPIGAWHGNGRKAQWWSPILLAVWDEKQGRLVAVCKCMSGFTDAFYKSLNEQYAENSSTCSKDPLGDYDVGGLRPTVYFEPREVWEVACAEITISPVSVAALGEVSADRGLSARFPRFLKVREDKRIEDATPATMLAQLWRKQDTRGRTDGAGEDDGDLVDVDIPESEAEDAYEEEEDM